MEPNRKYIDNLLSKVTDLKQQYKYSEKDLIRLSSQIEYEQIIQHFEQLIAKLTKELMALPIGHRYSGTFYLKKPYSIPAVFEKYDGSLLMREGLISWQPEKGTQPASTNNYCRQAFKQPNNDSEITKADAVPVYATNPEFPWREF